MTNLQQLYAERERLKRQKVTGVASSMKIHQEISKIQEEIEYYELGDSISESANSGRVGGNRSVAGRD